MFTRYYAVLIEYHTIPYYTMPCYAMPYYTILWHTILYYAILYYNILYTIHYTLYTIHYILYAIYYTLYTIYYILYTILYYAVFGAPNQPALSQVRPGVVSVAAAPSLARAASVLPGAGRGRLPGPPKWPKQWALYCLYTLYFGILDHYFELFRRSRYLCWERVW